jgi:hypothetical protein
MLQQAQQTQQLSHPQQDLYNSCRGAMQRAAPMATFNFASYYMNTALSDVTIRIVSADGSPMQADLPGHGILLSNVSPLFKEEIEDNGTITLAVGQVRSATTS